MMRSDRADHRHSFRAGRAFLAEQQKSQQSDEDQDEREGADDRSAGRQIDLE
jgi:hypothetical protein